MLATKMVPGPVYRETELDRETGMVWVEETVNSYYGEFYLDGEYILDFPLHSLPQIRRSVEAGRDRGIDSHYIVRNRRKISRYPLCAFCGARPRVMEYDCDGPYWTASCDSDQCVGWDVRRGRRNLTKAGENR
jgi:hypothetical protein